MITYIGTLVKSLPIIPDIIPMTPQDITCQTVHIPIPNNILDKKLIKRASKNAAPEPKIIPQMIISAVTGCTFGKKTKIERPITPSAANMASNVNL